MEIAAWMSAHGEWASLMATCITLFGFAIYKSEKTNDRLDTHMTAINARADELHKEFYELLKELRRKK